MHTAVSDAGIAPTTSNKEEIESTIPFLSENGVKIQNATVKALILKDGVITDDNRIKEEIPTLKYLLDNGAAGMVMSHLGGPEGQVNLKYSLNKSYSLPIIVKDSSRYGVEFNNEFYYIICNSNNIKN